MILELFRLMLKEEVRIHTKLFPRLFFYMFPFVAFLLSFVLSFLFNSPELASLFMIIVFFAGVTSGAYGLQAREIYLRKFPHLNFLLYSYFAMPIKNEIILFSLFLKEITFSFFWFLLPFLIGLFSFNPAIIISSTALFLLANSISFLLSNIYNKKKIFYPALLVIAAIMLFSFERVSQNPLLSFILFLATFSVAMKTVDLEYYSKKIYHKNLFDNVLKYVKSPLLAKDLIDLKRSYGFARIIVSTIFPIIVVYILLAILQKVGVSVGMIINEDIFYSLMLGLISLAVYDTMVEFDRWDFYSIFPLKKSDMIKGKLKTSMMVSVPLLIFLVILLTRESIFMNLITSLISMFYFISLIIYLVGLDTSLLLDTRRLAVFALLFVPYFLLVFLGIQLPFVLSLFAVFSIVLLKFGIKRFD